MKDCNCECHWQRSLSDVGPCMFNGCKCWDARADDTTDAGAIRKRANDALECFDGYHVCSTWMSSVQTDIPTLLARIDDLEAKLAAVQLDANDADRHWLAAKLESANLRDKLAAVTRERDEMRVANMGLSPRDE